MASDEQRKADLTRATALVMASQIGGEPLVFLVADALDLVRKESATHVRATEVEPLRARYERLVAHSFEYGYEFGMRRCRMCHAAGAVNVSIATIVHQPWCALYGYVHAPGCVLGEEVGSDG